ncbi:MAG: o-succinylbenzoate synthase [Emcibacter sp.]|nr:o-succinylbenzoate synthase [Emcibacter sp.]
MIIERIDLFRLAIPLAQSFRISSVNVEANESILVRIVAEGEEGWGESHSFHVPAFCPEYGGGQFHLSKSVIAPALLGKKIDSGQQLQEHLAWIKGNNFAKAAFDLAWWDLEAKLQRTPLYRLIGGCRDTVEVGADFGIMEHVDDLLDCVSTAVTEGYKRIKLKVGLGWNGDVIKEVRQNFPEPIIHVDCNSAFDPDDANIMAQFDACNLAMIEQPFAYDDLLYHSNLQKTLRTPICLDESITSLAKVKKAIALKACGFVNIKLGRVGGITPALQILKYCEEKDIPCWVGGMLESRIGQSHSLAFATMPNIHYPSDIFPSNRFFSEDLTSENLVHSKPSEFSLSQESGIGVVPNTEKLDRFTAEKANFGME